MGNVSSRLIKGSFWISASRGIVNVLAMLSTIVLARFLTPLDFGLVAIATTLQMIVSSVTELSLAQALVQHKDPKEGHFHAAWTLNALRGLILGLAFGAAGPLVAHFYADPRLSSIMMAIGVSVFLSGLTNPRRIMLQRKLIFWQDFVLNVSQKLAGVIAAITVAIVYQSYWALVVGAMVTQITNVLVSYTVLPFRPRVTFRHAKDLFSFSMWLSLSQMVNVINWRFDYLLVGKMLGKSELGFYSVGSNLAMMATREVVSPLTQTMFPGFAAIKGDKARLAAGYQRAQTFATAMALPVGVGTALLAEPLVRLAMGEKWVASAFVIQGLASVFAVQTLGSLAQPLAMASGASKILFVRDLQILFLRIPLLIAGMMFFGLAGAVGARVCSGLTGMVLNLLLVRRFTGLGVLEQLRANLRAILGTLSMVGAVLAVMHFLPRPEDVPMLLLHVLALVLTGAAVYCGATLSLWFATGRPKGPETELLQLAQRVLSRTGGK